MKKTPVTWKVGEKKDSAPLLLYPGISSVRYLPFMKNWPVFPPLGNEFCAPV